MRRVDRFDLAPDATTVLSPLVGALQAHAQSTKYTSHSPIPCLSPRMSRMGAEFLGVVSQIGCSTPGCFPCLSALRKPRVMKFRHGPLPASRHNYSPKHLV